MGLDPQEVQHKYLCLDIMNKQLIILTYISLNIILLFTVSPIIDHFFTDLNEDESTYQILLEVILQILVVSLFWYVMDKYFFTRIKKQLNIEKNEIIGKVRDVVIAVIFVGLQSHLIAKLEYISKKHPFSKFFLTE